LLKDKYLVLSGNLAGAEDATTISIPLKMRHSAQEHSMLSVAIKTIRYAGCRGARAGYCHANSLRL